MDYFHVELRRAVQLAVPLTHTAEVLTLTRRQICPIPGVGSHLLGTIDRRGRLLWVLELGDLLGLPQKGTRRQSHDKLTLLELIARNEARVGCVVSALKGIVSLDPDSFQPVPSQLHASVRPFLQGMTAVEGKRVAAIDVPSVLAALRQAPSVSVRSHSVVSS